MYYFYYFPLGTETRLKRVPVVTAGLAATLVVVHYLLYYFEPTVHLYPSLVLSVHRPSLLQAFTACFVHGGLFHLVGNLLYLVTFGPALEDRIGRWSFLGFYLVAGLVSMLVQVEMLQAFPPERRPVYILGASGAIAGILGMFGVRCWFLRVRVAHATVAYFQGAARGGINLVPAWIALAAWSLLQAVYSLVSLDTESTGIAYWSHTSGLALGLTLGLLFGLGAQARRERRHVSADRYLEAGSWYAALGEYQAAYRLGANPAPAKLGEARCLRLLDRRPQALAAYREAFAILAEAGDVEEAVRTLEEMKRMTPTFRLPSEPVLRLADSLYERGDLVRATDLYEQAGRWDADGGRGAEHLKRAGDIARSFLGDLERAAAAYADAAAILSAHDALAIDADRIARLMAENRACLNVLAKRLRFAERTA
jgi:membrane associated rhomboid family serine protease